MTSDSRSVSITKRPSRIAMTGAEVIVEMTHEFILLRQALRDLLALYDKVTGAAPEAIRGVGWDWAQMKRLQEIRGIVEGHQ